MPLLSVKIPDKLNRKLMNKVKEFDFKDKSDLVRRLLDFALEHYDHSEVKTPLKKKMITYNLLTCFLLEKFVTEGVEGGKSLIEEAVKKANKVAEELLK